jgi:transcriptional regulator with XRE-family HTH domain
MGVRTPRTAKNRTPKTVGERIELARGTRDISQAKLAELLDVTRAAVSQYEQDRITPRGKVIDRLAEVFHTVPEWFTHGRGPAPKPEDACLVIPEIDLGAYSESVTDLKHLRVGRDWVLPRGLFACPVTAGCLVAFAAPNAVADAVCDGDAVVVDTSSKAGPGVFLVYVDGGLWLRRLRSHAHILGRVIASFRSVA